MPPSGSRSRREHFDLRSGKLASCLAPALDGVELRPNHGFNQHHRVAGSWVLGGIVTEVRFYLAEHCKEIERR